MATVWFLKRGESQTGEPRAQKTLEWCVKNLGLRPDNWFGGPERRGLTIDHSEFRFVVVKIDDDDIRGSSMGWKLGLYMLDMIVRDADRVLDTIP